MELAYSHIAALYSLQKLAASNSKFFSSSLFKSTISSRRLSPEWQKPSGHDVFCPGGLRRFKSDLVATPADRIRTLPRCRGEGYILTTHPAFSVQQAASNQMPQVLDRA